MLIDFTVENYRSIKDPVTLSAIAAPRRRVRASEKRRSYVKTDNEIAPPFVIEGHGFGLLPVLGIFGPNASGKSNVVRALGELMMFLDEGSRQSHFSCVPFLLDTANKHHPTRFVLRIASHGIIYTYTLEVARTEITHERLEYMLPSKRNQLLYSREWHQAEQNFQWTNGDDFAGPHIQLEAGLKRDEPFLRLLNSRLNVSVLLPIHLWLAVHFYGNLRNADEHKYIALYKAHTSNKFASRLGDILRQFDTGLSSIDVKEVIDKSTQQLLGYRVLAKHNVGNEQIQWNFEEESHGTQHLLTLASQMLLVFDEGGLLIRDELEAGLHPQITRAVIRMFQSAETNPKRAQLIFTSHDYMLQRRDVLRRDQIWYTRKRPDHSTELYSLSEFKERNDRDIAQAYIEGRYGAVPILPSDKELLSSDAAAGAAP